MTESTLQTFEHYRPMLFGIAYRMLGSAMDAEDILQETFLRYQSADAAAIESPRAFLSTIVTRLSIDHLRSARVKREQYIGPWLPEPILTDQTQPVHSPAQRISQVESISMAFLVLLESLTPAERAVFLLREVFDYAYADIAQIVDKEEATCRQLFSRAKKHLADNRPRFDISPETHQSLLTRFLQAATDGDMDGLTSLLADDVILWADGGGQRGAATRPVYGQEAVAKFILGIRRFAPETIAIEIKPINGIPAVVLRDASTGLAFNVIAIDAREGKISTFRIIANRAKLRRV